MGNSESSKQFEGNMFLYKNPVLLTKEAHSDMGLSSPERPFDFVKDAKGLPIVASEIQSAQKHYPVVFSEFEKPLLVSVVGIIDEKNLFVNDSGEWDKNCYVPSYARCYPFAFARRKDDEYAVVIDESARSVSTNPEIPFFDGDDLSAAAQQRVDFCGQVNEERQRTQAFCERVRELGLLRGQRIMQTMADGAEVKVADYVSIDPERLNELDKDTLQELHQDGSLSAIFAQLFSLENWNRLISRRNELLGIS